MKPFRLASLLFVVVACGVARADEPGVYDLLEKGKPDKAYALAQRNHAAHPDQLDAQVELAAAEASYMRFADGERRLDELIAAHPSEPEPLRLQAYLHFTTARRDEGWQYLERALALAPEDPSLLAMRDQQKVEDAMFSPPPIDTLLPAARVAAGLFEDLRKGATNRKLAGHFAPGFATLGERELEEFMQGFRDSASVPNGNRMALAGYAVDKLDRDGAGNTVVMATVIVRIHYGQKGVEQIESGAALGAAMPGLGPSLADMAPEERTHVLARLVGYDVDSAVPVEVVLTGDDEHARIKEIRVAGISMSTLVGAAKGISKRQAEKKLIDAAGAAAKFILAAAAIGIIVTMLRRRGRA